jgi:hypothetical protein
MKTYMISLVAWMLFSIFLFPRPALSVQDEKTLNGIVQAVDWNEDDEVIAVSIVVSDTEMNADGEEEEYNIEYFVQNDDTGQQLLALVGHQVEVTGEIEMDEDGNYTIHINKFKVKD